MTDIIDNTGELANDSHFLGEFENVYAAMNRYPHGGRLGDYIIILGVKHYWNEESLSWGILDDVDESVIRMVEDMLRRLMADGYVPNWLVFVFRQSIGKPDAPTGVDRIPEGWSTQNGSGENWWVSTGIVRGATGEVVSWSEPVPFTGRAANAGVLIFKQWPTMPEPPASEDVLPEGWESGPTSSGGLWWMCKGDWDGVLKRVTRWSTPVRVTGLDGNVPNWFVYVFRQADAQPPAPTGVLIAPEGWKDYPDAEGAWWMSMGTVDGTTNRVTSWSTPIKCTGEDGTDGEYVDFKYALGTLGSAPAYASGNANPGASWFDNPPAVTDVNPGLWMIKARKRADGSLDGIWSVPVRINGENGKDGADGQDGMDGVPGPPGADGVTYYTWIRYADTETGAGMSNSPNGKKYIGFAYNKTTAVESNTPADYTWSLFHGEDGTDGVPGAPGSDGKTYYTWIAYSDYPDGTNMYQIPNDATKYIGIAVNKETATESNNPSDYTWSRFRGEDGQDGMDGVQGPVGPAGPQGPAGTPGVAYYTWIKYADTAAGGGLSDSPSGKTYIGLAYNKTTPTESNTPSDYTWSLIKGDKGDTGVQGPTGANGQTYYTWIKYSDYSDGTNLYDTPTDATLYIGIAVNKTTAAESTNKADYTWSKFKGDQGVVGPAGAKGQIVYPAGEYSVTAAYTTDANKAPYVLDTSDNTYYVLNKVGTWLGTSQGNKTPYQDYSTNGANASWIPFQNFEAVFTKLLMATNGLLGSAVFNGDYMFSQRGVSHGVEESSNYQDFDHSNPNSTAFKPYFWVNLRTGESNLGKATFDGVVKLKTSYSGSIADANLIYIRPQGSSKTLEMPTTLESKGKVVTLYNNGSDGFTHKIRCRGYQTRIEDGSYGGSGSFVDSEIKPKEIIEVSCFERDAPDSNYRYFEWVVTNRRSVQDFRKADAKGRYGLMVARCTVTGSASSAVLSTGTTFNSKAPSTYFSVSRTATGIYRVTINDPGNVLGLSSGYFVSVQGHGNVVGSTTEYCHASLATQNTGYFDVVINGNTSIKDGSFDFILWNNNWDHSDAL